MAKTLATITIIENGEGRVHTGFSSTEIENDPDKKEFYDVGEEVTLDSEICAQLVKRGFATGVKAATDAPASVPIEDLGATAGAWQTPGAAAGGTNEAGLPTDPAAMTK